MEIKEFHINNRDNKDSNINDSLRKKYLKFSNRKILINVSALVLFISAYYLYYLSLEKCFDGVNSCSRKWKWMMKKVKELIISIIIIIHKIISRFHI